MCADINKAVVRYSSKNPVVEAFLQYERRQHEDFLRKLPRDIRDYVHSFLPIREDFDKVLVELESRDTKIEFAVWARNYESWFVSSGLATLRYAA